MQFRDFLHDSQSQTAAVAGRTRNSIKPLKDMPRMLLGNTGTAVFHP